MRETNTICILDCSAHFEHLSSIIVSLVRWCLFQKPLLKVSFVQELI